MRVIALAIALLAMPAGAASVITNWSAASGLLPGAVSPPYDFSGDPANATLGGGVMTLDHRTYWGQDAVSTPGFDAHRAFSVEARVRFVSGSHWDDSREGIGIFLATGGGFGNSLFIGNGRIFVNAQNLTRGDTALVDTSGFHTYRLDVGTPDPSGAATFGVTYDGVAKLAGTTFYSLAANGPDSRFGFGGGSIYADARSEWAFVRNTAGGVPEPDSWALLIVGFALTGWALRRPIIIKGVR